MGADNIDSHLISPSPPSSHIQPGGSNRKRTGSSPGVPKAVPKVWRDVLLSVGLFLHDSKLSEIITDLDI